LFAQHWSRFLGLTVEQSLAMLGLLVSLLALLVSMSGEGEGLGDGELPEQELSGMPFCVFQAQQA
jgi:hypothetical protein